jgi:phosphonopyruvate decarboxylase
LIEAHQFIEAARAQGFGFYTGVPCSFLEAFINHVIEDERLTYISSANEGDAVASALGAVLGGQRAIAMMQNSGLGNAVNPLVSLAWPFQIPVLLIVTLRGDPKIPDELQHLLMGRATGSLLDLLEVPWELFPSEPDQIAPALQRACSHMRSADRPYAFVMRKGTVKATSHPQGSSAHPLPPRCASLSHSSGDAHRFSRAEVLHRVRDRTPPGEAVVIASTGYTGRELYAIEDRANQFYMAGSMGCATSLALGLSLARPDLRVVAIEGDGAALMRMGNYATLGGYGRENLIHLLLDNEMHESTGGQSTVSARMSFAGVAAACGYAFAAEGAGLDLVDQVLDNAGGQGPRFAQIKIRSGVGTSLPRPSLMPAEITRRFMHHIGTRYE